VGTASESVDQNDVILSNSLLYQAELLAIFTPYLTGNIEAEYRVVMLEEAFAL
jgi:hypothetical protein